MKNEVILRWSEPVLSVTIVQNEMFFKNSSKVFDLFQILTACSHFRRFALLNHSEQEKEP